MFYDLPCTLPINAQDAVFTTYRDIACTLQTNANNDNFYGRLIDCTLPVTTFLVDAAKGDIQSIRVTITCNGQDVSAALVGEIGINHMKNACSTFSFYLNDFAWSPLISIHTRQNKIVIITAYINGYEKKIFTGLIDGTDTISYGINYKLNVYGRDYGKKLERKKMSLISVQNSAANKYRGSLVKYMAAQAGITDVECPKGSYVRIDHSFHYQSILDMIVKELNIDTYWWRVDEEGRLKVALSKIKTDVSIYPTAEWDYGVDRFTRLGLKTGPDDYIINKLKVMGAMYEHMIEVENPENSPAQEYITPASGDEETQIINSVLYSFSDSWSGGALITGAGKMNNVQMTVTRGSILQYDSAWDFPGAQYSPTLHRFYKAWRYYKIEFKGTNIKIGSINYSTNGYIKVTKDGHGPRYAVLHIKRQLSNLTIGGLGLVISGTEMDGGISIELTGQVVESQNSYTMPGVQLPPVYTSAIVDNKEVAMLTYEFSYTQVSAEVTDPASIAEYGERKPDNEGTLEFPLAENAKQCEGIAKHVIRESHRFKFQPNFEIPFNPLFLPGQTAGLTDPQVGFAERYHAEGVMHIISVDPEGKPRAKTLLGCVYYA
jgi:hypothetical protein